MSELKGLDDLKRALDELTQDLKNKVVKSAIRYAAKPIITAAKANVKVLKKPTTYRIAGLVRDRIVVTNSRIHTRTGQVGLYIKPIAAKGVTKGAKSPLDPFYYRFQAGGFHAVGSRRVKGGRLTRKANLSSMERKGKIRFIPGDDFIGKAFRAQGDAALKIFQQKLKARIDAANRRK